MKRKVLYILLSLMIALGLWAYVVTVISPEWEQTYYDIPVVLSNENVLNERGLMITSDKIPGVTLKLYGNRSDLRKLNSSNITIVMDVSRISEAGNEKLSFDVSYPGDVPGGSIEILEKSPELIDIKVSEKKSTKVPVQVEYSGKVPEQFIVDKLNLQLLYETVTAEGPAEVIEKIDHARINVDLEGKTETINSNFRYTLCDANDNPVDVSRVTTNVAEIPLKLVIQMVKKVDLVYKVVSGGGATERNSIINLSPLSIQVSGSEQLLEDLDKLEIGTINLGDFEEGGTKLVDINSLLPNGVTNLTSYTVASMTMSFPGLSVKEMKITDIRPMNVPKGMVAEILTDDITVKIRGPKDKIELITEENVTVYVDFSEEGKGVSQLIASVYFDEGFSDVGIMGTYAVHGRLEPAAVVEG